MQIKNKHNEILFGYYQKKKKKRKEIARAGDGVE